MRNKMILVLLGAGISAVAALAAASASSAQPQASLIPGDLVPALAEVQSPNDASAAHALPANLLSRIDQSSVRLVGSDDHGRYLVATTPDRRDVCVFVQTNSAGHMVAGTCTKTEDFFERGSSVEVRGSAVGNDLAVYLLPNGVDASPLLETPNAALTGISYQGKQIVSTTNPSAMPATASLARSSDGQAFNFTRQQEPPIRSQKQ